MRSREPFLKARGCGLMKKTALICVVLVGVHASVPESPNQQNLIMKMAARTAIFDRSQAIVRCGSYCTVVEHCSYAKREPGAKTG